MIRLHNLADLNLYRPHYVKKPFFLLFFIWLLTECLKASDYKEADNTFIYFFSEKIEIHIEMSSPVF